MVTIELSIWIEKYKFSGRGIIIIPQTVHLFTTFQGSNIGKNPAVLDPNEPVSSKSVVVVCEKEKLCFMDYCTLQHIIRHFKSRF